MGKEILPGPVHPVSLSLQCASGFCIKTLCELSISTLRFYSHGNVLSHHFVGFLKSFSEAESIFMNYFWLYHYPC